MKKVILIMLLVVALLTITACAKPPIIQNPDTFCPANGYVHKSNVNNILNVTNKLVDLVNVYYQGQNMTPLSKFTYIE